MTTQLPANAKLLFVGNPFRSAYGIADYTWRQVEELGPDVVMRQHGFHKQPDGRYVVSYIADDAQKFVRVVSVKEEQQKNWTQEAKRIRDRFLDESYYLLEVDERVSPDHLVCRVLSHNRMDAPEVCIGKEGWDYVTNRRDYPLLDGRDDGKRNFLTLDGNSLWEIIEAWSPMTERGSIRIEIVRRRALTAQGFGSVFEMSKPDFIQDPDRKREIMAEVERIEHGLATADHWNCVLSCGKLAERILTELGKQRLRGGKTFGTIATEEQLFKQTYKPLQDGFVAEFTRLAPDEMKWLPGALDMLKSWADENRHAGKNERQLLDADQHTAHACYGALRDFIRLLMRLHRNVPDEIAPRSLLAASVN